MPRKLTADSKRALAAQVQYAREMGIGPLYRRSPAPVTSAEEPPPVLTEAAPAAAPATKNFAAAPAPALVNIGDKPAALAAIRAEIGPDCQRCRLGKSRTNLVFGVGNVNADIMFIGEGPGADEDASGEPFVGRAGQLLNNMITAMGLKREDVYIANVVKCRPPGNRTPEKDECETCSPFLMQQIDVVQPKVIVALGAVASKTLLALNDSMANLRGRFYDFRNTKLAVTYHPAYLLRDPRQKAEAWKDLQMVMAELGMTPPARG